MEGQRAETDCEVSRADDVLVALKAPDALESLEEDSLNEFVGKSAAEKKVAESGGQIVWRIANGLMTIFFVMAVGVQFNDPDPYLWVPLYGIAAFLTVSVTVKPTFTASRWWKLIYWTHTTFCFGMFGYVFVALIVVATNPKSDGSLNPLVYEEGREMAGIMITVIWLFTCKQSPTIKSKTKSKTRYKTEFIFAIVLVFSSMFPLLLWALCYSDAMNSTYFSFCGDYYMGEFSF